MIVEDNPEDAELAVRELVKFGYTVRHRRVETAAAMREALTSAMWDAVLADYALPSFSGPAALAELQASGRDLPFIVVSGTIGEDVAVAMLKAGAHDDLLKGWLARLGPALERELREVQGRARRRAADDALRASEERFRTLVSSLEDVVFTLDRNLRYDGVYGGSRDRGWDAERMLGRTSAEVFGDQAAGPHGEANLRALRGERVVYECAIPVGDRAERYQVVLTPRRSGIGETLGLVGVARELPGREGPPDAGRFPD